MTVIYVHNKCYKQKYWLYTSFREDWFHICEKKLKCLRALSNYVLNNRYMFSIAACSSFHNNQTRFYNIMWKIILMNNKPANASVCTKLISPWTVPSSLAMAVIGMSPKSKALFSPLKQVINRSTKFASAPGTSCKWQWLVHH